MKQTGYDTCVCADKINKQRHQIVMSRGDKELTSIPLPCPSTLSRKPLFRPVPGVVCHLWWFDSTRQRPDLLKPVINCARSEEQLEAACRSSWLNQKRRSEVFLASLFFALLSSALGLLGFNVLKKGWSDGRRHPAWSEVFGG